MLTELLKRFTQSKQGSGTHKRNLPINEEVEGVGKAIDSIGEVASIAKDNLAFLMRVRQTSLRKFGDVRIKRNSSLGYGQLMAKMRADGFAVLPGFLPAPMAATLRAFIDVASNDEAISREAPGNDVRIYFADEHHPLAGQFRWDSRLRSLGAAYMRAPVVSVFSLLARASPTSSHLGSGGSWHQDSRAPQFKAMVYLSDVECEEDGAFQIVPGTHRFSRKMISAIRRSDPSGGDRWTGEEVDSMTWQSDIRTITGGVGDCLIFDSSSLHRGHPVRTHNRYAMTNYYYPTVFDSERIRRQFVK